MQETSEQMPCKNSNPPSSTCLAMPVACLPLCMIAGSAREPTQANLLCLP